MKGEFMSPRLQKTRISGFAAWTAAILWLSLTAHPLHFNARLLDWDKFDHAAAYALLTLLGGWVFALFIRSSTKAWLAAFLFAVLLGGLMEIAQGLFTTVRTPDWRDLLADAVGAGIIYGVAWLVTRLRSRTPTVS